MNPQKNLQKAPQIRVKRLRKKSNQQAPVRNLSGSWNSRTQLAYTVLENWKNDAGAFDDGNDQEEKDILQKSWDDMPLETQRERAESVKANLREGWKRQRPNAISALLGAKEPPLAEKAKQEFMEECLAQASQILAEKGWGPDAERLMGVMHEWHYHQTRELGPAFMRAAVLLARWEIAAFAAAKGAEISEREIEAIKNTIESAMDSVVDRHWTSEQAEELKSLILSLGAAPEWLALWTRAIRENMNGHSCPTLNLARAFGLVREEDERAERNRLFDPDNGYDNDDPVQREIAFEFARKAPMKVARKMFSQLIVESKRSCVEAALQITAARPDWVHPKEAAGILFGWLATQQDYSEASQWGKWREKTARELARALQAGCSKPIDWKAAAAQHLHCPWGASHIEGKKKKRAVFSASFKGRRLNLAQIFWIQNNEPAIAWLEEMGIRFTVDDARDLLDMMGNSGMALEFSAPMSQPLKKIVAEHEARELQTVALANRRAPVEGSEGESKEGGGATRRGRGRRL